MKKNFYCHGDYKFVVIVFLFFGLLLPSALSAQEQLLFIAERDTVAFREDGTELLIQAGEIIAVEDAAFYYGRILSRIAEHHLAIVFGGDLYAVFAKHFRSQYTEDVFGEDIFIDHPVDGPDDPNFINTWGNPSAAIGDAMWVPYFFADILRMQDRNKLIDIRPRLEIGDDGDNPWYMNSVVNLRFGRAMFLNSGIMLGDGTRLAVRNIRRTDFGYSVDCVVSTLDGRSFWGALLAESAFWAAYSRGDAVTLLLYLDGDYLDIYTYGSDIHVGTFIRVGREFQTQYQSLIRWNTSDLTNVVWPQRADGSRHFTPPVVQPSPAPVAQEIDEPVETTEAVGEQAVPVAQDDTATSSMPPWLLAVIIGGVAVVGGVVLFAVKRKR